MKVEVPKDKFNNLTNSERKALYDLKNDKNIEIKSSDKSGAVVVWDIEDYVIEAEKNLVMKKTMKKFLTAEHLF